MIGEMIPLTVLLTLAATDVDVANGQIAYPRLKLGVGAAAQWVLEAARSP